MKFDTLDITSSSLLNEIGGSEQQTTIQSLNFLHRHELSLNFVSFNYVSRDRY